MNTLLLYASYTDLLSYYDDWVDAFLEHPSFNTKAVNVNKRLKAIKYIAKEIENAELIILHHSMNADTLRFIKPLVPALKARKGKLLSFIGNEVNLPSVC